MIGTNWVKEFNSAITVCDTDGKIIYMNDKAASTFAGDGGYDLIGKNIFDCHSEQSTKTIKELIRDNKTNSYTIEKNGVKKLIYQSPWYEDGSPKGLVEISIEIPFEMPHHIRS